MAAAESAAIVLANIQSSEAGVRSRQRRRTSATHPASARRAIDPEPGGVRVKVPLLAVFASVCAPVCAPVLERGAEVTRVAARSRVFVTKLSDSVACDSKFFEVDRWRTGWIVARELLKELSSAKFVRSPAVASPLLKAEANWSAVRSRKPAAACDDARSAAAVPSRQMLKAKSFTGRPPQATSKTVGPNAAHTSAGLRIVSTMHR